MNNIQNMNIIQEQQRNHIYGKGMIKKKFN